MVGVAINGYMCSSGRCSQVGPSIQILVGHFGVSLQAGYGELVDH